MKQILPLATAQAIAIIFLSGSMKADAPSCPLCHQLINCTSDPNCIRAVTSLDAVSKNVKKTDNNIWIYGQTQNFCGKTKFGGIPCGDGGLGTPDCGGGF